MNTNGFGGAITLKATMPSAGERIVGLSQVVLLAI